MSRDKFLKALQHFDTNYNAIRGKGCGVDIALNEIDKAINNYKQDNEEEINTSDIFKKYRDVLHDAGILKYMVCNDDKYAHLYNRVDLKYVRQITINKDNCFTLFYGLDDNYLFALFEILTLTELALKLHSDVVNMYRKRKQQNRNLALQNKMNDILDYAKEISTHAHTGKYNQYDDADVLARIFERLGGALNNKHYTERQIFQNLLWHVSHILSNDGMNSYKVAKITNAIIEQYFAVDMRFSRNEDTTKYTATTYHYAGGAGITLFHS